MKKLLLSGLCMFAISGSVWASFLYQEIDPICSISGTTHTSFPWEISDTSSWNIPKAYDGKCDNVSSLTTSEKIKIHNIVIDYLEDNNYLDTIPSWYTVNKAWRDYLENGFFPAVQNYIVSNRNKIKNIAILNHAVSMVEYDYYVSSKEYLGLTESEAIELAQENGVNFRVWQRDGEIYAVTMDYVVGRITATIENGIVTDYSVEK